MNPSAKSSSSATEQDPRWAVIVGRDKAADGRFWYSVATTGVYCRPSCPSRACNPRNVRIHDTLAEARATGARPCRRCEPDATVRMAGEVVARACRLIEAAEETLPLSALAAALGISPYHFHRTFRRVTGVTPKAYADACRAARLRNGLATSRTVTEAMYGAGYGSSGRFYARSTDMLGMTPTSYRAGGARETLQFAVGQCSLGAILVACSAKGVAAILIGDDPDALARALQDRLPNAQFIGGDPAFEALVATVVGLVDAPLRAIDLPLDVRGTAFQQRVWQALRAIPPGQTASYAEIAARIGAPRAVRAVGAACGANMHAVAIPCHRVVRTDGGLSGYRWGVERKRALLELEAAGRAAPARMAEG